MLSKEKSTGEEFSPIRMSGSTDGGLLTWILLSQHNHLLQIRPCQADATTRQSSNKSSDSKDLALRSIPLLPRNQYTFLVSTACNFVYNFVTFIVSSKSPTKFDTVILDFQREKQISIPYKQCLPSSTCIKILKPYRAFPHKPFSPARQSLPGWTPEIIPNSFIFPSNGNLLWVEAISIGCLFFWEILPLDKCIFVT